MIKAAAEAQKPLLLLEHLLLSYCGLARKRGINDVSPSPFELLRTLWTLLLTPEKRRSKLTTGGMLADGSSFRILSRPSASPRARTSSTWAPARAPTFGCFGT